VRNLRAAIGRDEAPVLIDQEGGRVARLQPPHWRTYPAPGMIASLRKNAEEAAFLSARLIAEDLNNLAISVNCVPVLDLPIANADNVIGDRAWGLTPDRAAIFGRAVCGGMLQGGVLPVIKHIPGHGRATVDTHHALPVVATVWAELERTDFEPFRLLNDVPLAMTAHVVYAAIDSEHPATLSRRVIDEVIRSSIGFDGMLLSDDLSMNALSGGLGARAGAALAAGCDVALHCNGKMDEMIEVAKAAQPLSERAAARFVAAEALRVKSRMPFDRAAAEARFAALMAAA
jgi:beta-N-acetylhexosaminidase